MICRPRNRIVGVGQAASASTRRLPPKRGVGRARRQATHDPSVEGEVAPQHSRAVANILEKASRRRRVRRGPLLDRFDHASSARRAARLLGDRPADLSSTSRFDRRSSSPGPHRRGAGTNPERLNRLVKGPTFERPRLASAMRFHWAVSWDCFPHGVSILREPVVFRGLPARRAIPRPRADQGWKTSRLHDEGARVLGSTRRETPTSCSSPVASAFR